MYNFKNKVVYQIWPRSFKDSNGDGIGDICGIIGKLPYLKSLGVDVIWLSPIYATQNHDYGYDIDDYYSINPEYGTMEDFDTLMKETKRLRMGVVMDLVVNHTSDRHKWFREAVSDPASPYRDYYFFRKGRPAASFKKYDLPVDTGTIPPNNWLSAFGGSAWQKDPASGDYYLTTFTPNQCDLNWENPAVREGVWDIMRFWLDKGIAGFRLDVINVIAKAPGLPDVGDGRSLEFPFEHIVSLPESHDYLKEMHDKVLSHYDCFTVGEGMVTPLGATLTYTHPDEHELDMMFQFDLALIGCGPLGKYDFRRLYYWNVKQFKRILDSWQSGIQVGGGWLGNYFSNHDQPRCVSRFGNDREYRVQSAKALATINLTLPGTPFIYQGEEIGMTNVKLEPEDWRDFEAINDYRVLQEMMHLPSFLAKKVVQKMTRDHARTPVQWSSEAYAGFSEAEPWIKVNPNYTEINVADDMASEDSIIAYYTELIKLRHVNRELCYGKYRMIAKRHPYVIAFLRTHGSDRLLTVVNLSKHRTTVDISEADCTRGRCMLSNYDKQEFKSKLSLRPYEAAIFRCLPDDATKSHDPEL